MKRREKGEIRLKWVLVWITIFTLSIWALKWFADVYLSVFYQNEIVFAIYIGAGISIIAAIVREITFHPKVRPREFLVYLCTHIAAFWFFNLLSGIIGIPHNIFYYIFVGAGIYVAAQIVRRL